ncbi:MAG: hypothetical protein OEQ39_00080 [Gammaproteobacteria bacterium]|nr:hypothetical protein [Gammaproteobacteria bacterium]
MPFLQELQSMGRETQLDNMPELDELGIELWEMYCFCGGDHILQNVEVYARKIGLPYDWEFRDCVLLMSRLSRIRTDLERKKREQNG